MTDVATLFSGSTGNAVYLGNPAGGLLFDAGRNLKAVCQSLDDLGYSPNRVKAVFVTHTHSDHISALRVLTKHFPDLPVYGTETTLETLDREEAVDPKSVLIPVNARGADVLGYHVAAFPTPHDAPGSCGFLITTPGGERVGLCTDLGHVPDSVLNALSGCGSAILESNDDVEVLKAGPYPYPLKRRILGEQGHLSNADCAGLAATLFQRGCRNFVLAHLSQQNNHPQLAYETTLYRLMDCGAAETDFSLSVAAPDAASRHCEVR